MGSTMNYAPVVESLHAFGKIRLGPKHTAVLYNDVKSAGRVEYEFIVGVFDDETDEPVLFVASEVNSMKSKLGGGSHFLGLFPGNGHVNLVNSDDWADAQKFYPKALEIAAGRLGVTLPSEDSSTTSGE